MLHDSPHVRDARRASSLPLAPLLLAAALLAGCSSGPETVAPAPGAVSSDVTIEPGDVVILTVWGMSCPKCVTNVDQLLREVPGVEEVRTDMSDGTVTVRTGRIAPDPGALSDAITEAGFTLMQIQTVGADA